MEVTAESLKKLTITEIAETIVETWQPKVHPYAAPYLKAMLRIEDIHEMYFSDDAYGIVLYFLSNAQSYRGDTARLVKAELKARCKQYEKAHKMKG